MQKENFKFQAEVSRLLDIVTHALYSDKDIFLRELISNSSDACDKIRYLALTTPEKLENNTHFKIKIIPDANNKTLTISDNGIGMDYQELIENLGTIAQSGTAAFLDNLKDASSKEMTLIGQFGVGFYSSFIVSQNVKVHSRKAGESRAYLWSSEGKGDYSIEEKEKASRGTDVILQLKEGEEEYLEPSYIKEIVQKYSDHIAIPIILVTEKDEEQLNKASALWTRPKTEISEEDYKEFYHHISHLFDEPWHKLHFKAEGLLDYTALLFIPSERPIDLFHPDRKPRLKLYVRKVFITDQCDELIPSYLRFLRGIIDSEDLPLNVSREVLQKNPVVTKIRHNITKKVLEDLSKKVENLEEYTKFWNNFGAVLKEGIYEDFVNRDQILKLARFHSSISSKLISLDEYIVEMKEGQKDIYYLIGDNIENLKKSPHLEGFIAKGINVLLLTDPVDDFWIPALGSYQNHKLQSITKGDIESSLFDSKEKTEDFGKEIEILRVKLQLALAGKIKEVKLSHRLKDSVACLVADQNAMDLRLEKLLKQHQGKFDQSLKILEINAQHPILQTLLQIVSKSDKQALIDEMAHILYAQAVLAEGEALSDPKDYVLRVNRLLEKAITF